MFMKIQIKNAVSYIASNQSTLVKTLKTQGLGDIFDLSGEISTDFMEAILALQLENPEMLVIPPTLAKIMTPTQLVALYKFFEGTFSQLPKKVLEDLAIGKEIHEVKKTWNYLITHIPSFNNELLKRGDIDLITKIVQTGFSFSWLFAFEVFLGDIFNPQISPFVEELSKVVRCLKLNLTIPPDNGLEYGFKRNNINTQKPFVTSYCLSSDKCGIGDYIKNIIESVKQAQNSLHDDLLDIVREIGLPPHFATITPEGIYFADGEVLEYNIESLVANKGRIKKDLSKIFEETDCSDEYCSYAVRRCLTRHL